MQQNLFHAPEDQQTLKHAVFVLVCFAQHTIPALGHLTQHGEEAQQADHALGQCALGEEGQLTVPALGHLTQCSDEALHAWQGDNGQQDVPALGLLAQYGD